MPAKRHLTALALTAALFAPLTQATNGYLAHGFGVISKGMAGAGMALPQDTLSVFNNPAGLTRLGRRFDAELEFFSPRRQYTANDDFAPPPAPASRRAGRPVATICS